MEITFELTGVSLCLLKRGFFAQHKMSSVVMIVVDISPHETYQMALIQDDDVVEEIATAGADPPLGHAVLPGASNCGANRSYAQTLYGLQRLTLKVCSRSRIRYLGAESNGKASRICCATQAVVGCRVTLQWRMRRRS